jgi:hypothetical protein
LRGGETSPQIQRFRKLCVDAGTKGVTVVEHTCHTYSTRHNRIGLELTISLPCVRCLQRTLMAVEVVGDIVCLCFLSCFSQQPAVLP